MQTLRPRRGFTLLEMLVSMALMLMVFAAVVPFFRVQLRSIGKNANLLDAQQNIRFALATIQRELRAAGAGVVDAQPMIVQASPRAVTFNVDLVTKDPNDPSAVYYDEDADASFTTSLTPANKIHLPGSSRTYPDTTYWKSPGVTSRAETISYWVTPDVDHPGQYVLYRRVNNADSTIVSSGIILSAGQGIFKYFVLDTTTGVLDSLRASSLPLYHTAPIHGSPADTGASALTDKIRMVTVDLYGTITDPDSHQPVRRHIAGDVRLLNAGLLRHSTCGQPPIPVSLTATIAADKKSIILSWNPSVDDGTGEKDVERYMIFRRSADSTSYGEAYTSIAAGATSYTYFDVNIKPNDHWVYGVAAEDCTPASSPLAEADPGVVPVP